MSLNVAVTTYNSADINECVIGSDECDVNAMCVNTLGGYLCMCNVGFIGNGFTCKRIEVDDPCGKLYIIMIICFSATIHTIPSILFSGAT